MTSKRRCIQIVPGIKYPKVPTLHKWVPYQRLMNVMEYYTYTTSRLCTHKAHGNGILPKVVSDRVRTQPSSCSVRTAQASPPLSPHPQTEHLLVMCGASGRPPPSPYRLPRQTDVACGGHATIRKTATHRPKKKRRGLSRDPILNPIRQVVRILGKRFECATVVQHIGIRIDQE